MPADGGAVAGWLRSTVGRGGSATATDDGHPGSDGWGGPDEVTVLPAPRTPPAPAGSEAPAAPPVAESPERGRSDDPGPAVVDEPAEPAQPDEPAQPGEPGEPGDRVADPVPGTGTRVDTSERAEPVGPPSASGGPGPVRRRTLVVPAAVLALALVAVVVVAVARSDDAAPQAVQQPGAGQPAARDDPPPPNAPTPRAELPRGGTTIFPRHRVVAFYGTPDTDQLGVLGEGTPEQAADRLDQAAAAFATPDRVIQPAMEIIATVADGTPGPDGNYSHDVDPAAVRRYIDVARAHRQLVVLDLQPGTSDFLTVAKRWEPFLSEPDVSLALDPEWRMEAGEVPGRVIGNVTAAEVNQVSAWLADIVRTRNLPQKMLVLHQFTPDMIGQPETIATPPELAVVQHIDGFGAPPDKLAKYRELQRPQHLRPGFKLFYDEDTPMLDPQQTLGLSPTPEFVTYQ